jgi:hypothetical protein
MNSPLREKIVDLIARLAGENAGSISDETPLLGNGSLLDSMKLVELCLGLEDIAEDSGFVFDWRSDAAMSRSRSMFRTAGSLTAEFIRQSSPGS